MPILLRFELMIQYSVLVLGAVIVPVGNGSVVLRTVTRVRLHRML